MANTKLKRWKYHLSLFNEFKTCNARIDFAVQGFPIATLWYPCCELILELSRRHLKQGRNEQAGPCRAAVPVTAVEGGFQHGCIAFQEGMPLRNVLRRSGFLKSRGRGCSRESAGANSLLPTLIWSEENIVCVL